MNPSAQLGFRYDEKGNFIIRGIFTGLPPPTRSYETCNPEEFESLCESLHIKGESARPKKELVQLLLRPKPNPILLGTKCDWSLLPVDVQGKIYPYQRETVETIVYQMDGRCLLTAPMGRGKTAMACMTRFFYGGETLIVAPLSTLTGWKTELKKWTGVDGMISEGTTGERYPITIASYNAAKSNPNIYGYRGWRVVIFDESHTLKNPKTICSQKLLGLGVRARCCLMLSATPRLKCSSELYCQILPLLGPKILGNWEEFTKRYCSAKLEVRWGREQLQMGEQKYKSELNCLLGRCMVRLAASNESLNLPPLKRIQVEFELPQGETLDELIKIKQKYVTTSNKDERDQLSMELWRKTGQAKLGYTMDWIKNWLKEHPGEKLVVFAHSVQVLRTIGDMLTSLQVSSARIDGSTNMKDRAEIISNLSSNTSLKYRVGLLTFGTCALGITLCPGVSTCVFAELIHTPAILEQCEGKLHRLGACREVYCIWIVATNSHDMSMLGTIQRKTDANAQVLDGIRRQLLFDPEIPSFLLTLGLTKEEASRIRVSPLSGDEKVEQFIQRFVVVGGGEKGGRVIHCHHLRCGGENEITLRETLALDSPPVVTLCFDHSSTFSSRSIRSRIN
jgi:SNF2 family DNA or RNA helicase